jgi:hypothetical protein
MATNNSINKKSASITFDGTNVLSNYVTATSWTPEVSFAGGQTGITYSAQSGYYSRIGNIVFFQSFVALTSKGSDAGYLRLQSLPIAPSINSVAVTALLSNVTFTGTSIVGYTYGTAYISFVYSGNSSETGAILTDAECDNDLVIRCSGFYFV